MMSLELARATSRLSPLLPIFGVIIAIAGTTTIDATGLSAFTAFALLPLMLLFGTSMDYRVQKWDSSGADRPISLSRCPFRVLGTFSASKVRSW